MASIWRCFTAAPHSIFVIVSLFARNVDMLSMIQAAYSSISIMGICSFSPSKDCRAADKDMDRSFRNWIV